MEAVARLKIHTEALNFLRAAFLDEEGLRKPDCLIDIPNWEEEEKARKQQAEHGRVLTNAPPHLALSSDPTHTQSSSPNLEPESFQGNVHMDGLSESGADHEESISTASISHSDSHPEL